MPAGKGIKDYTTTIDPAKTAGECFALLARHGAAKVMIMFDASKAPTGLAFEIITPAGLRNYTLPINADGVLRALRAGQRAGTVPNRYVNLEQATRTAWRVLKDWLDSQLALIEAGMSALDEVMFPWEMVGRDETMYHAVRAEQQAALTSGAPD